MKIEIVEGCVADSFTIDDEEVRAFEIDDLKNIVMKATEHVVQSTEVGCCDLWSILREIVMVAGKYECSDEPCEQCGDYITTYTLEL